MSRHPAEPVELSELRGWMRGAKKALDFDTIARHAIKNGRPVSACTLRRAMDGRLPTLRAVLAFARGTVCAHAQKTGEPWAGKVQVTEQTAQRLWEAAAGAVRREATRDRRHVQWVPGRITTRAGLARAMRRIQAETSRPSSLRALAAAPEAAGQISRSALHLVLTGARLPSEQMLIAFTAACGASEEVVKALLDALRRLDPRLSTASVSRPGACADASWEYQAALARQERGRDIHTLIGRKAEDWYEREMLDGDELHEQEMRETDELWEQQRLEDEEEWHEQQLLTASCDQAGACAEGVKMDRTAGQEFPGDKP
ncbi:hypothetical protein [Streptomyces sp. NEAU-YJ-81]|uniref:hypothetical protein n=1 Tax=Streptomyces sp. NEAU-YJ-81 TaxID=2820288 RepID=UPI001ABD0E3C|nr:hypothetical protein [Streptomyces sp. NEAU-YJ-81]MBO3681696.1 hypothetical protein [Streptomyces sp. NEAU-YJ-81]